MNQSAPSALTTNAIRTLIGLLDSQRERLDYQLPQSGSFKNQAGAQALAKHTREMLKGVRRDLNTAQTAISLPSIGDKYISEAMRAIRRADAQVTLLEKELVPSLSTRTSTDAGYDRLIQRFLRDLTLHRYVGQPVSNHKQRRVPLLCTHVQNDADVYLFSPTARSFDGLSLLYHEFGHNFWNRLEHDTHRMNLYDCAAKLCRDKRDAKLYLEEILADAFAVLLGGMVYLSSLCALSFITSRKLDPDTQDHHPSLPWRYWFCRQALVITQSEAAIQCDPVLSSAHTLRSPESETGREALIRNEKAARRLLGTYRDALREFIGKEALQAAHFSPRIAKQDSPPDPTKTPVPELLRIAWSQKCRLPWSHYLKWEREHLPQLVQKRSGWWSRLFEKA